MSVYRIMLSWRQAKLWAYGPHREPVAAAEYVQAALARIEVEAAGLVAVPCAERTRPVVAIYAGMVELGTCAVACDRQEDGVAVRAFHLIALHAVLRRPGPGASVEQFLDFVISRYAPRRAELGGGGVVGCFEGGFAVSIIVLGHIAFRTPLVSCPGVVCGLWLDLSPCVVVAVVARF